MSYGKNDYSVKIWREKIMKWIIDKRKTEIRSELLIFGFINNGDICNNHYLKPKEIYQICFDFYFIDTSSQRPKFVQKQPTPPPTYDDDYDDRYYDEQTCWGC